MSPWRQRQFYLGKFIKYLFLAILVLLIIGLVTLMGAYQNLKTAAQSGLNAKTQLSAAVQAISDKNIDLALTSGQAAEKDFTLGLDAISAARQNWVIKNIAPVRRQIDDLDYLLKSGEIISRSLNAALPIIQNLEAILSGGQGKDFSQLSRDDKARFLKSIHEAEPELIGLKANLDLSLLTLDRIHRLGILYPIYAQISNLRGELQQADLLLTNLIPLAKLLPALSGYPAPANYLVLLQNNDELRPTGGFIGVYGLMTTDNGDLVSLQTEDSYHVDMPAVGKWKMEPPAPIKNYLKVENWYLRDANWSPDWPTAAQKTAEIYRGEMSAIGTSSPDFTGIIAITPDLIADLISLVGPITIQGETYRPENFQELLQYNVEIAYKDRNISSWNRKDIVNELLAELKRRLFSLPSSQWKNLLTTVNQNIAEKNIQLYFFNPTWEALAQNLGATGIVEKSPSDFLMVVDANLAAFKSDAVVKKEIQYNLTEVNNGLKASVRLNYAHTGGFDWRTTRYRSYTRVYAPLGSRLISLTGLDQKTDDFSATDDLALGKTVFGFFFTIEPGAKQEISLDYSLPDQVYQQFKNNTYQLLVEKQAGRRTEKLAVSISAANKKGMSWTTDLKTDQSFSWNK